MAREAVALAAAVGKPDAYAGELPIAFVQLKPGMASTPEELQGFVRDRIPERAAAPSQIFIVPAMPLTAVGKIFKPELRNRAARDVYARIVRTIAGAATVDIESDPVHGNVVVVTLASTLDDPEVEKEMRSALDRFICAYRIVWRDEVQMPT